MTAPSEPTTPGMAAQLIAGTAMFAVAHGVRWEEITRETGLTRMDLVDPDQRFPNTHLPALWRLICAAHPGQAMTLKLAESTPFTYFGALAYGAQYAASFKESLQVFIRYRSLLSDQLEASIVETEASDVLRISHPLDEADAGAAAETGLAMGLRFVRDVMGVRGALQRIDFTHQPFGPHASYTDYFGVPVEFGALTNAMVFHKNAFKQPLPAQDPALFNYIQAHLAAAHKRLAAPDALASVRDAIARNAERSEYGAEAVARSLGMSLRVLQRRVSEHGTTLRALIDQARETSARQLLGDRRLSVEEVAFLLGYSEARAFRRAFKRMTGSSPAQYRKSISGRL